jgi:hypothetical protein
MGDTLLVAGLNNPALADYASHRIKRGGADVSIVAAKAVCATVGVGARPHAAEGFSAARFLADPAKKRIGSVVVFLDRRLTARGKAVLKEVAAVAREAGADCVCVVSSFRIHLGDRDAARAEDHVRGLLQDFQGRVVVVRPGHVRSRRSPLGRFLRGSWLWLPVLPGSLQAPCVDDSELFALLDAELAGNSKGRRRTYTLLGPNIPWRERARQSATGRVARAYLMLAAVLLPLAPLRGLAGLLFRLAAKRSPKLGAWHVPTLRPGSLRELLALYNPHNHRHVKVVGYNNGVVHFGQKFPGRTVVPTTACGRLAQLEGELGAFDAGVTVRRAMDTLAPHGRELHVLPNYSYVSLGTAFFIPIHGSASTFSTIADTIERVLLYDPAADRCILARRGEPAFGRYLYNLAADVLLLRLWLRTKEKSRYFVRQVRTADPPGRELLDYFHDDRPCNVEVRKAGSKSGEVQVYRYYADRAGNDGPALEVPRDALGRLWDRLEENPVSSVLFHGLTRSLAHHVELFLSEQEFETFWRTHRELPLWKIQLRYVRRDGFPHSPFCEHDCVCADLFMRKKHRGAFEAYLRQQLRTARHNPGKHSTWGSP